MDELMLRIVMAARKVVEQTMDSYDRTKMAKRALVPYPMIDELAEALREAGINVTERKRRR
jgi:signal recognition particle subunit SEC65